MASNSYYQQQPQPYYGGQPQGYPPPPPPPPPPQQQQQQQQPYYPPPQYVPNYDPNEKQTFEQTFKIQKRKWNDLWAGILFIIFVLAFAGVSGYAIQGYSSVRGTNGSSIYDGSNTFSLSTSTIIMFAFVLAVAIVFSYAYVWVARVFPKQFIWVTGILNILFGLASAVYMLYQKYYSGGIVFLVFVVFFVMLFISWIPRIPFSALMLKTSIDVSKLHGHVYAVSALGGLLGAAFGAWYAVTLVAVYNKFQPGEDNPNCGPNGANCSQARVIGLLVFLTFTAYWISEWIKNTIHTTIAGVYGSWYFCSRSYPQKVTRGALKRALTYSFGSISLGSLIVAIINTLRQLCSVARRDAAVQGDLLACLLFACLSCLIGLLEWAVEFINRYAFVHIALYGKAYFPAAKDTWRMIKDRGIDALIVECLIGPVLGFGAMFVGYACALLAYLYLLFTNPAYNREGGFTPVVVAYAFLIGLQICNIFTTPISSGIDTIFVATAWDPDVLMRDHPDLYNAIVQVYPQVQQAIHA